MSENQEQQRAKALLKKYLLKQCNAREQEIVEAWYTGLVSQQDAVPVFTGKKERFAVRRSIHKTLKVALPPPAKARILRLYIPYAAVSALLLVLGASWYFYSSGAFIMPRKEILVLSPAGSRKEVTLADGTVVLMNSQTTLKVSAGFGEKLREVSLEGEAFFKVTKNPEKPFVIHSGRLNTRVLGTSFNISAYPEMERIKVSVSTGKVQVSEGKDHLLAAGMLADQTLSFYKKTGKHEIKTENTELIASWRSHKLYIDNASIEDIARQLEHYYGVEAELLKSTNLKNKYTIRFNNESMKGVLDILSALTRRKFSFQHGKITIK
ncbi:FecR family protein [Pedobacter nutrimenti]|jgi:ferric-dicitrate binding protein FerR (iron transport regulator)|uniref:FecR family protein n=1 Tax=Pedobacter nutrimenti TaxID=1241337 RepID=A0A318UM91_9SPHI|nr:FecR family protein [Pedobacter nutrimenti]PYF76640.1 FecR family protein [Pedobacter nutrimenti]